MNTRLTTLALLLAVLSPAAFADRKSDLEAQAQQAAREKRLDAAADAYCELAKVDSSRKSDCDAARQVAANEGRRNDERYQKGVAFFNQGTAASMDDAEQQLKNIHFGPHYTDAQNYLNSRIPAKRKELADAQNRQQQQQQQLQASDQTYKDAVQAYNANNFDTAKTLFQQVKGGHQQDAQNYINKINQYQSAMGECTRLANAGQHRQAQSSCEDAARIKPDGPGNPTQRAQAERDAANQPAQPTQVAQNTPTPEAPQRPTQPQPQRQERTGAVKEVTTPKIDIDKTLHDADAARTKGDKQSAKSKYVAVLAADPGNDRARKALDEMTAEEQAQPQAQAQEAAPAATPEADVMLTRAIGEYYRGLYIDAEGHIKDYQNVNGSKKALGYFYSGVSKLTRYFLGGETDKKLLNDAEAALRIAKSTSSFKAPGEDYVSPRILKVYNSL